MYLTFDLEGSLDLYMLPLENVIANFHVGDLTLIVKDGLDLTMSPLNMCDFMG